MEMENNFVNNFSYSWSSFNKFWVYCMAFGKMSVTLLTLVTGTIWENICGLLDCSDWDINL